MLADTLRSLAPDALRALVDRTHEECSGHLGESWWRLVREAYEHGASFRAPLTPDTTTEGEASYASSLYTSRETYLQRFPREHWQVFQRRVRSSTYENHVSPVVDIYHGHLTRRPPQRTSSSEAVSAWWQNADARGRDVQTFIEDGLKRAQLFGWAACLFDRARGDGARGDVRTVAQWIAPEEVRDWQIAPDGSLDWIRIVSERCERDPVTDAEVEVYDCTVWTRTEWARVVLREAGERYEVAMVDGAEHGLGRVPVAVLRWQPTLAQGLYGLSQVGDVVPLVLALFNRRSELTHHLRSAVFALLCVQSDDPDVFAKLKLGTNNGVRYATGTNAPSFIAPPADVAATLRDECESLKAAIYVAAKVERPKADASGGDAASGIARAYDFAATEAALLGAVRQLESWEYEAAAIVALWDAAPVGDPGRVTADTVAATSIAYPRAFDAAGLARDIAAAFDLLDPVRVEQMLPHTRRAARVRIARALEPDATPADEAEIALEAETLYQRERSTLDAATAPAMPGAYQEAPGVTVMSGATTGAAGA